MKQPEIQEIRQISLPSIQKLEGSPGPNIHFLHDHQAQYIKFELVIHIGRYDETFRLGAKSLALVLKEGFDEIKAKQLAAEYDNRGASLLIRNSLDHLFISFVCLTEFAQDLIEVTARVCQSPRISDVDLFKIQRRQKQKLKNDISKTEVLAYRQMTSFLYGEEAPYGYNSTAEMYDALETEQIRSFHQDRFLSAKADIFLTGFVSQETIDWVQKKFAFFTNRLKEPNPIVGFEPLKQPIHIHSPDAQQSSIRIYKGLFTRSHEDYSGVFLINLILGGYFGSRLMKNIRESAGLTYGIYSSIDALKYSGYMYISTETSPDNVALVKSLIRDELRKMCLDPISERELEVVKRYISGQFLRMVDGPLNIMKVYRSLLIDGIRTSHLEEMLDYIWSADAPGLSQLCEKYLQIDSFHELTVGPKKR